ncbi:uncharacterized protein LOC128202383 [Galleria mellonella]|uniref:Uncharacterized protein LOC128202383 n=1 Tax=Galleria mellonella TaxID=7137 RepID=A0ABM3N4K2_GALME|nr:uncharacterized protein LOC128202383 [Galleria mellonella]
MRAEFRPRQSVPDYVLSGTQGSVINGENVRSRHSAESVREALSVPLPPDPDFDPSESFYHQQEVGSLNNAALVSPSRGRLSGAQQLPGSECGQGCFSRSPVSEHRNDDTRHVFPPGPTMQVSELGRLADAIFTLANKAARPSFDDLPTFSGNVHEWLLFKKSYDDSKSYFTPHENMSRLRNALRGNAREAVSVLLLTSSCPEDVLQALELRFARPEQIILSEISAVRALPKLGRQPNDIFTLATKIKSSVNIINLLGHREYIYSPELLHNVISKLTPLLYDKWCDFAQAHHTPGQPQLELLAEFLLQEANKQARFGLPYEAVNVPSHTERTRAAATFAAPRNDCAQAAYRFAPSRHTVHTANASVPLQIKSPISCAFCSGPHSIKTCFKFLALAVDKRITWVKQEKLCQRCLKRGKHSWRFCKARQCDICKQNHHKFLHSENSSNISNLHNTNIDTVTCQNENINSSSDNKLVPSTSTSNAVSFSNKEVQRDRILLKILPVILSGPTADIETFALLDDGSSVSIIDADLAKQLGLSGPQQNMNITTVVGTRSVTTSLVDFNIKGKHCSEVHTIKGARAVPDLTLASQSVSANELLPLEHLCDLIDVLSYSNATPKLLIGLSDWHLLIAKENRVGTRSQPVATRTALGWVLYGLASKITKPIQFINHCVFSETENYLDTLIRDYYRLDAIGLKLREPYTASETRAIQILDKTIQRLPNGRFEVGLPWRYDSPIMPNSYNHALSRLNGLNKRFKRDPNYQLLYKENIEAYVKKGYAEECNDSDDAVSGCKRWYLPHFGVTNPNKPGKLRIVHDASAKSNGVSLNSLLLPGPDLLQSLVGILIRFREGQVALSGDIKEMFPQIKIREADRDCQRYLWQPDGPDGPIREFRMSSLIFGAASSPFTAIYVKNKNARDFEKQFPEAAKAIIEDHYMDDFIGSVDDIEVAARLAGDIVDIHSRCGFEMRAWISNKPEALRLVPSVLRKDGETSVNLDINKATTRVLGLFWNPVNDSISFNVNVQQPHNHYYTKRQVLKNLMRIFDPLGFLCPFIIQGKILFQRTWRLVTGWDDQLPQSECVKWLEWYRGFEMLKLLSIPRCYSNFIGPVSRELHVFSDASDQAYACVAYWRLTYCDGSVKVAFVMSKSRVSSLEPTAIARLELQAALLGVRLAETITREQRQKINLRYFWCDSRVALSWIRSDARNYKAFVANRVGEISESTLPREWRWVPSDLNVADDATRVSSKSVVELNRWLNGPSFLMSPVDEWPVEPEGPVPVIGQNLKCHQTSLVDFRLHFNVVPNSKNFSSWLRLLRATARAHQFLRLLKESRLRSVNNNDRFRNRGGLRPLLCKDMKSAELHLLRQCQAETFSAEIAALQRREPLPKFSKIAKLSIKQTSDGLLRLDGRVSATPDLCNDVKYPPILDGRHHIIHLLIHYYHVWACHGYNETVVNELRQRFWIFHLRPTVRSIAARCQACRLRKASSSISPEGDLPVCRLEHHQHPFLNTGLDYFGPVDITIGRRHEKRYIALFTCLSIRAVHLEVVGNLSADAAIMALRRFMARRGVPKKIFSDNAKAFVGASREIRSMWRTMNHTEVAEYAVSRDIEWNFIPPQSPFMGGCWERLVQSVKRALTATVKSKSFKEEILVTLLAEVEHVINSRPLTHVPVAADDEPALTPNHFLLGRSSGLPGPVSLNDGDLLGRSHWRKTLRLADHFWSRWLKEYVPSLTPRRSQNSQLRYSNLSVDDIVLIADANMPRGLWPKGRITRVFPGHDGIVRVVDVATTGGVLRRPSRKLIKLSTV